MTDTIQYLRSAQLIVANSEEGIDLSAYRIRFDTHNATRESPNHAEIRVYNLSSSTIEKIQTGAYGFVILNAGYEIGNFGTIFKGSIMQMKKGRESNLDTYLDLFVSDGDIDYNQAMVKDNLRKGSTLEAQLKPIFNAMENLTQGKSVEDMKAVAPYITNIRGKVLFGYARAKLRNLVGAMEYSWYIQDGEVQVMPYKGYTTSTPVDLTPSTGLIGTPEQTDAGIVAVSLLNPNLKLGSLVRILPDAINQEFITKQAPVAHDSYTQIKNVTPLSKQATYLVVVSEHSGDTRGANWHTYLTMVGVDTSASQVLDTMKGAK